jgi:hypothetical protein
VVKPVKKCEKEKPKKCVPEKKCDKKAISKVVKETPKSTVA